MADNDANRCTRNYSNNWNHEGMDHTNEDDGGKYMKPRENRNQKIKMYKKSKKNENSVNNRDRGSTGTTINDQPENTHADKHISRKGKKKKIYTHTYIYIYIYIYI